MVQTEWKSSLSHLNDRERLSNRRRPFPVHLYQKHEQERFERENRWQKELFLKNFQPSFAASELKILEQGIVIISYTNNARISEVK